MVYDTYQSKNIIHPWFGQILGKTLTIKFPGVLLIAALVAWVVFKTCTKKWKSVPTQDIELEDVINNVNKKLSDDELNELYALYKQYTTGDVNTPRPGMLDFQGKRKWDAWNGKKGMEQAKAKEKYVALVAQLKEEHALKDDRV